MLALGVLDWLGVREEAGNVRPRGLRARGGRSKEPPPGSNLVFTQNRLAFYSSVFDVYLVRI